MVSRRRCAAIFRQSQRQTGSMLERATHPLPRAGVPLHHRTKESPQSGCHFLPFRAKTQIVASKTIRHPLRNHFTPAHIYYRNLWSLNMKIGCVRSSRLFRVCAHMGAGSRSFSKRNPVVTSSRMFAGIRRFSRRKRRARRRVCCRPR